MRGDSILDNAPPRSHRYKCSNWDLAVIFFPLFHALEPQRVIRIGGCLTVYIDYDERQDHFFWVDLINSPQSFYGVRRLINVCSPLTDMREQLREKSRAHCVGTLVIPVDRLSRFIGGNRANAEFPARIHGSNRHIFSRRAFSEFSIATYHQRGRLLKSARGKDTSRRVYTPKGWSFALCLVKVCLSNWPTSLNNIE